MPEPRVVCAIVAVLRPFHEEVSEGPAGEEELLEAEVHGSIGLRGVRVPPLRGEASLCVLAQCLDMAIRWCVCAGVVAGAQGADTALPVGSAVTHLGPGGKVRLNFEGRGKMS